MKKISLLLAFIAFTMACFGQVSSYTFSSSSGSYTPLSGGTALIPAGSGISGNGWSCQNFNVTIPFVFYYNGIGYSDVYVNSNGYLTFGKPALASNGRPSIVNDGQSGSICGFAASNGYGYSASASGRIWLGTLMDFSNSNPIQYGTVGTAPNRTFVVQWTSCYGSNAFYATSGSATESVTFQIRLAEGTNNIDIVYNTSSTSFDRASVTNGTTLYPLVGLCGASTADYRLLQGSSFSSVTSTTATPNAMIVFDPSNGISAGTTYSFAPPSGLQPTACSGTPSAPSAIATHGITCGPVGLGLINLPLSTGLNYQWQSSRTGLPGSWSNISGATGPSLITTPDATTYYQCLVACGAGTPVTSSPVVVGFESTCPAMPSYTQNGAGTNPLSQIGLFSITGSCSSTLYDATNGMNSFNLPGFGASGTQYTYLDMTLQPTHIKLIGSGSAATTYTATIGNYGSTATYGVWMDINDNGSFGETGEYIGSVSGGGAAISVTLTIPANAFGVHRMRLRCSSTSYSTSTITPTGSLSGVGATNDYMVEVVPPTPTASSSSPVCVNGRLDLIAGSLTGATYTWSGPLSYSATTTSSTQTFTVTSTSASGAYSLYTTVGGATSCSSASTTVTVNPQPSLTNATNSSPICAGNTLSLFANSPTNVTGYAWVGPVAITSSGSGTATVPGTTPLASGTYTVTVSNGTGAGCNVNYVTTATVNPLPAAISGTASVCIGSTTTLSSSGTGTWSSSNGAIATVGASSGVVSGIAAGTATITYTLTSTGCYQTVTVTVNAPPAAIGGGTSPFCPGSTTTLTNSSSGGTWTSADVSMATINPSTGVATGVSGGNPVITYTLGTGCFATKTVTVITTPAITGGVGLCAGTTSTLSNSIGGGTWTSSNPAVATIGSSSGVVFGVANGTAVIMYTFPSTCTITTTVNVTSSPAVFAVSGGGTTCSGTAGVSVVLSGSNSGVSYQLYNGGVATGSPVFGTGGAITFAGILTPGVYTVVANPGSACSTSMTGSAVVNVYASPNIFNISGGGSYCSGGSGVHIYLSGSNPGINYQLYNGATASGTPLGGTGTILDFGFITATGTYSVTATNTTTGCVSDMVGTVTVTANPLPAAYIVTGSGAYCTGGPGLLVGLSNSETTVNYQLYRGGVAVGSAVAGTGGPINFGLQTVAGSYTVIGTNATTGCIATMTGAANITVNPPPTIYNVTGGGNFCFGGAGVAVGLSGSSAGVTYQLYRNGTSTGSPVTGTGGPLSFGNQTGAGVYTVVATSTATTCTSNMLGSATVMVNPLPVSYAVTGGGAYCAGTGGLPVGLAGSELGASYTLYRDGILVDAASGTTAALDFGLHTVAGVYTISASIPSTGCVAPMTGSVTISINPLPNVYSVTGAGGYCVGGAGLAIGLASSQAGVDYYMTAAGDSLFLLGPVPGTGSALTFGTFPYAGTYTVAAVNTTTGCFATMGSAVIVKNALPTAYIVTGGGNYCSGGTGVAVGLSNSTPGVSYQLYLGASPVGTAVAGTGAAISFGLKTTPGTYTVSATNVTTTCTNMMTGSVVVGVTALPSAYNVTGGGNYCAGGSGVPVGLANSVSGVNYQLYRGVTAVGGAMPGTTGSAISFGMQTIAGVYTVKATDPLTGCMANMTGSATVGINTLPTAYNVTGGGNYCVGGAGVPVGLSNSATGISYQLYNGGSPAGSPIAGSGFALDFGAKTAVGTYTIIATNITTGCAMTMTGSVTINTNPLPVAYAVTGGGSYCSGGTGVHVGLLSSTPGNTYQLYVAGSPVGVGVAGTGSALDFGVQTLAGNYTVKATDNVTGCVSTMLGSATISINTLPAVYIVTGGGNYCVGGLGLHVGLTGSQTGVDYQLFNGGLMVGAPMSGTGAALDFGFQTGTGTYTVVATNTVAGCTSSMGGSAAIAISTMPTVYTVTNGGNYCPSASGSHIGLSNSDIGVSYQVFNSSSVPVGSAAAGTGSAIDMGIFPAGVYSVVATGTGTSCTGNMFGTANIAVNPSPAMHNITGGGNFCAGYPGVVIGLDGSDIGTSYQLYLSGGPVGAPVAGTGLAVDFGLQTAAGVYSVVATDVVTSCTSSMAGPGIINVDPLPAVYNVSGGGNYCSGGTGVHIYLNGSVVGVDYQLFNGVAPIAVVPGSGSIIDFGAQTLSGNYTVKAVNSSTGCEQWMTGSANVNINALPTAFTVGGGGNYCTGSAGVHVTLSSSQSGVSYQLYRAGIFLVGAPIAGTGGALDFGLQTVVGAYTVVATNTTTMCVNNMMGSVTVTPMPLPLVYSVSGSSAGYCSGGAGVTPIISGSDYGVTYQLYRGSTPVGVPMPGTGGPVSFPAQTVVGSYTVIGTNTASGCVSNMTGGAGVVIYPNPTVYTVTGGGSYCNGGSGVTVGLSGSDIGTSYQLMIGGAPGPILLGTGSSLDFGLQTAGGYYTVVATNATGCVASMTGSANVLVNALPGAYSVTGGGNYCSGGSGVFVGLSGSSMGVNYKLYWGSTMITSMPGTGSPINFGLQTASGGYTVIATNSVTGCSKLMTGSATVGVNSSPAVYAVVGGGSYCSDGTGVHIGIAGSDATGVEYRLYRGTTLVSGPIAGSGSAIDFGLQTIAGNYTVTGTNTVNGCISNMGGSATVVVNAAPTAYTVTGGGNYCSGGTGVHIGLSNSQTGVNYDLMLGASVAATMPGSGSALDFGSILTGGSYTVIASNAITGCSKAMLSGATVTVNPAVTPGVTISTGFGDTVCTGMLTTFSAMTVNAGTTPTFVWTVNGVPVGSVTNSYSYLPLDGDIVGVQMTSSEACATPATASNFMMVHVNLPQFPSVSMGINPGTTVCQGTMTSFTAVPVFGGTTPAYKWMKNGSPTGVTASTYSYVPANGDVISCIMYSNYRCRVQDSAIGLPATMTVSAPVTPVVSVSADPGLSISAGATLALTATASNAGTTPSYQWKVNGIAVPAAIGETYISNTFQDQDQVTCEVSSSGVCAGTVGSKTVTIRVIRVGVEEVNVTPDIKLLPNPTKGSFMLKGTWNGVGDAVTVEITNMLGQVIYTRAVDIKGGAINERIELNNELSNGMYILNLHSANDTKVFHLVVER